jgi:hypothetical protein
MKTFIIALAALTIVACDNKDTEDTAEAAETTDTAQAEDTGSDDPVDTAEVE